MSEQTKVNTNKINYKTEISVGVSSLVCHINNKENTDKFTDTRTQS